MKPDELKQLIEVVTAERDRLEAAGWTKDDFAQALKELLEPKPTTEEIRIEQARRQFRRLNRRWL